MKGLLIAAILFSGSAFANCSSAINVEGNYALKNANYNLIVPNYIQSISLHISSEGQFTTDLDVRFCDSKIFFEYNYCKEVKAKKVYKCLPSSETYHYENDEFIALKPWGLLRGWMTNAQAEIWESIK